MLKQVMVRTLGAEDVHWAFVEEEDLLAAKVGGAPATLVTTPRELVCGAVLMGGVVKMDDDQQVTCSECDRLWKKLLWSVREHAETAAAMGWDPED